MGRPAVLLASLDPRTDGALAYGPLVERRAEHWLPSGAQKFRQRGIQSGRASRLIVPARAKNDFVSQSFRHDRGQKSTETRIYRSAGRFRIFRAEAGFSRAVSGSTKASEAIVPST